MIREVPRRAVVVGEEIAAKMELLAERARAGEIVSIAWVLEEPAGNVTFAWVQDPKEGSRHMLVAGSAYLHGRLVRDAERAANGE